MSGALALQRTIIDMIDEFTEKHAGVDEAIATFNQAWTALEMAASVGGTYAGPVSRQKPHVYASEVRANLLKSAWMAIYDRLSIATLATAADRDKFRRMFESPPALTPESVRDAFRDYYVRPRFHVLRGLAECFVKLDPAYKSHSKVKVGVAGLPKRIILSSMRGFGSYGQERVLDILGALAAYRGDKIVERAEMTPLDALCGAFSNSPGSTTIRGVEVRVFMNGNGHVIFDKATLLDINRGLAEFYGDVLPDAEGEKPLKPQPGTGVSKDLQYYPTPAKVIDEVLRSVGINRDDRYREHRYSVLEPSCGDGRIMDELAARKCDPFGIEVHAGRAGEAKAKGHPVLLANFLDCEPSPTYDYVVMNPPFYGRHYLKHLRHARKFVKPGGRLVAILPATARYDHGELVGDLKGEWSDLPVASFAESGTNIPTGYHSIYIPK